MSQVGATKKRLASRILSIQEQMNHDRTVANVIEKTGRNKASFKKHLNGYQQQKQKSKMKNNPGRMFPSSVVIITRMMNCESILLQCDASDLSSLSDGNEN